MSLDLSCVTISNINKGYKAIRQSTATDFAMVTKSPILALREHLPVYILYRFKPYFFQGHNTSSLIIYDVAPHYSRNANNEWVLFC
jgi:hypothetical protein